MHEREGADITSPCISVCRLNERSGFCEGCWRTMDEISGWRSSSDAEKRLILARIAARKSAGESPDAC